MNSKNKISKEQRIELKKVWNKVGNKVKKKVESCRDDVQLGMAITQILEKDCGLKGDDLDVIYQVIYSQSLDFKYKLGQYAGTL